MSKRALYIYDFKLETSIDLSLKIETVKKLYQSLNHKCISENTKAGPRGLYLPREPGFI